MVWGLVWYVGHACCGLWEQEGIKQWPEHSDDAIFVFRLVLGVVLGLDDRANVSCLCRHVQRERERIIVASLMFCVPRL